MTTKGSNHERARELIEYIDTTSRVVMQHVDEGNEVPIPVMIQFQLGMLATALNAQTLATLAVADELRMARMDRRRSGH